MRKLINEIKFLVSNLPSGSWLKALAIAFVCLSGLAIALSFTEILALLYLYSFAHEPRDWTNVIAFYARPKESITNRNAEFPSPVGSLLVRGNHGMPVYATRYEVSLGDIKPSALHDCLLAAEDKRFYHHSGLDYFGIGKSVYDYFVTGGRLRGGSTISNQLIRTVILADRSRSLWRKMPEILLTDAAERHFSKDDLMLSYLNNVPIGNLNGHALIGFAAASEAIFGERDPRRLTLSEACTLAGMLNRPNWYLKQALKGDYRSILKRRNIVLDNLESSNPERYSKEAIERAKQDDIRFIKRGKKVPLEPRQFIRYAYQQLRSRKPGLRVYLTMDADLQRAAENAVNEELHCFDRGPYGFYNRLSYLHAFKEGLKVNEADAKLQAALVALDSKTGEILAMVGRRDPAGQYNRATQAERAPGSTIKPFLYLYALDSGSLNGPDAIIDPAKTPAAERYTTHGAATAEVQLARSDNAAAVAIAAKSGISRVRDFVAKITGADPVESEQIAIGEGKGIELSPLELAVAYTIFANHGMKATPNSISAIYDNGTNLRLPRQKSIQVANPRAADTVTRMLRTVIGDGPDGQYGTARMARKIAGLESSVALAGKTGTGDNDLWFVGFTPRLVVVVWVGFDDNYPRFEMSKGFEGAGLPLQIWASFMKGVKKYRPDLLAGEFGLMKATSINN
jgi:membrane peptidoglycan carboxypeptidase